MKKTRTPSQKHRHKAPVRQDSVEETLKQLKLHAQRADVRIRGLERNVKKLSTERDQLKESLARVLIENHELKSKVKDLQEKLDIANKQLAWFRRDKFGRRSEVDSAVEVQEPLPTDDTKTKRKRGQQPGSRGHGRTSRELPPAEEQILEIQNCVCPNCSKPFRCLPETDDSTLAEIEMFLFLSKYRRRRYAPQCKCSDAKIVTAPAPPRLYNRTTIANSLWVHLIVWKFLHGVPTNRVLKDLSLQGLALSAGTVTGGFKMVDSLVEPLYNAIVEYCQGENYWNGDETSWRVFQDSLGKTSKKNWWMWLVAGDKAVVYVLDESRSGTVPQDLLMGSVGTLMSDRFSAYKTLPDSIKKAWCWVHVRRDFIKILDGVPKHKAWARKWLIRISRLFVLHHQRFRLWERKLTAGPEWAEASLALSSHVASLEKQWRKELDDWPEKVKRTVLQSLKRHWDGLTLFLSDPRIPLDNNRAERLLRFCVISRKNSYGNSVEWAGHFSAKMFSIFQTWLVNGLDPQSLLRDYFDQCAQTPGQSPQNIDEFLPWAMSADRLRQFQLPATYAKPG